MSVVKSPGLSVLNGIEHDKVTSPKLSTKAAVPSKQPKNNCFRRIGSHSKHRTGDLTSMLFKSCPALGSHIRIIPSSPPVARNLPVDEKARALIALLYPLRVQRKVYGSSILEEGKVRIKVVGRLKMQWQGKQ
jgi:hypothetical protein